MHEANPSVCPDVEIAGDTKGFGEVLTVDRVNLKEERRAVFSPLPSSGGGRTTPPYRRPVNLATGATLTLLFIARLQRRAHNAWQGRRRS